MLQGVQRGEGLVAKMLDCVFIRLKQANKQNPGN
jgi:hypothetical protein